MRCSKRTLFDDLVGAQQNRWGYGKTERLGGLEVDDHLKFCRQLNGKVRRLRAAQNAIDISGGPTNNVYLVGSIGEQTAGSAKATHRRARRYVFWGRRRYDRRAMRDRDCIRRDDKAAARLARKADDGRFDFCFAMNGRSDWHDLE